MALRVKQSKVLNLCKSCIIWAFPSVLLSRGNNIEIVSSDDHLKNKVYPAVCATLIK